MLYLPVRLTTLAIAILLSSTPITAIGAQDYDATLNAVFHPESGDAEVSLEIHQKTGLLKQLDFSAPSSLFTKFSASSGKVEHKAQRLVWQVPKKGGKLSWRANLNVRKGSAYDTRITKDWAILRFEDLFPSLKSTARKGAKSNFTVNLSGPENWSYETRYGRAVDRALAIESSKLNFDRPTGWLIAGRLGVRRDSITGRSITVAAPVGSRAPRVPTLAFLRWTLPEFVKVFPTLPEDLLIVGGNEEMWRGGLSGPSSLFMHTSRPLISENGTSTLLHELVHVATRVRGGPGDDWIVEGLAEYYSLELLRRSGGLSNDRFDAALKRIAAWVDSSKGALAHPSTGADTAAAVLLFHRIAQELASGTGGNMDDAIKHLLGGRLGTSKVTRFELQASIKAVAGNPSTVLQHAIAALQNQ